LAGVASQETAAGGQRFLRPAETQQRLAKFVVDVGQAIHRRDPQRGGRSVQCAFQPTEL
jgi:hypothetical protein